ncbi:MAG: hypothetical protein Q8P41_24620 [Pseudomonadota bacterium]|nr:hypothetical protein [Pseudomonadota bacterium]
MLALGCRGPEVTAFLDDRAAAICARHTACDTLGAAGYASEADCLDALDAATGALADQGALACEAFDAAAADACLTTYAAAACDVPPDLEVCESVCR